jgi:DsbC/DsbD-like thiol-disulfide interchange protein
VLELGLAIARHRLAWTAVAACVLGVAGSALMVPAQAPAEAQSHAKVELIAEGGSPPAAGKPMWVGLLFKMDPGWHIYWRNAGDSGEPPKVKWNLPAGLKAGEIQWPTPIRLGSGSVIDYGYEDQVLLMAPIGAGSDASTESVKDIGADVRYVVCREICIPGKAQLKMTMDRDAGRTEGLFGQTRAKLPRKAPAEWRITAGQDKEHFVLTVRTGSELKSATFFPMDAGVIENSAPQEFGQVAGGFRLTLKKSEQLVKPVESLRGLVVLGPGKAYEVAAAVR